MCPIRSIPIHTEEILFAPAYTTEGLLRDDADLVSSPLSGDTTHDLLVKYQDTYGLYKNKPILFKNVVAKPGSLHGYEIHGYSLDIHGLFERSFTSQEMLDFNMTLPKLGFINHNSLVIYLERQHRRPSPSKYRKGLRSDSLIITNVSSSDYREVYYSRDPYDTGYYGRDAVIQKILHSLFFPIFYSYEEALNSLLTFKRLSCAISSSLALSINFRTNKILLHRNQFTIGVYNSKLKGIILNTELFTDSLIKAGVIIK
jgi:hypothetical protein